MALTGGRKGFEDCYRRGTAASPLCNESNKANESVGLLSSLTFSSCVFRKSAIFGGMSTAAVRGAQLQFLPCY